ncbi:MAG: nucleoside triphosphate pyrophosphohydrolase [Peptococcaceae bacterium]|nr:nucleoside triphosphate pyrophosphohydrolase [Peptococcaceae bacterium]
MARRSYNKLVRDKVPSAIVEGGDQAVTTVLEKKRDILLALDEKLDEEVCDYQVTKELAELADVLEVIHAIVETSGMTFEEFDAMRLRKREARGGFTKKILLQEIIE